MPEKPWKAMYQAVIRRLLEIANSDDDHRTLVADFERVAYAHEPNVADDG